MSMGRKLNGCRNGQQCACGALAADGAGRCEKCRFRPAGCTASSTAIQASGNRYYSPGLSSRHHIAALGSASMITSPIYD